MLDRVLDARDGEPRLVQPERVGGPAVGGPAGRHVGGVVHLHREDEDADVRDPVAALPAGPARCGSPHFAGMGQPGQRAEGQPRRLEFDVGGVAHGRERRPFGVDVVDVRRRGQQPVELDHLGGPAGYITDHLLQHRDGALALPVGDRVRDHRPAADAGPGLGAQVARQSDEPDQVCDVGDRPLGAGLDEP